MRVISWNILHPDFIDSNYAVNQKYLDYSHRLPLIVNNILRLDPDIACLQEADSATIESDFSELTEYTCIAQNDKARQRLLQKWRNKTISKPTTIVCAFLIKKHLQINPEIVIGSRSLTVNIFLSKFSYKISNVHLESGKGTNEIHIKHLSKLLTSDIICGDFNDWVGEPCMDYLIENGFNRAPIKEPTFKFKMQGTDTDNVKQIDHFFFNPLRIL